MIDIQQEIIPIAYDDLFIILNNPSAKFDYPVHYHPDYEINLVLNSRGERIVGDSIERFDALDLVMTGPNLPHAWKGEIEEGNHVVTIQFSDKLLSFPILEKRLFAPIKHLLHDSRRGLSFPTETKLRLKDKILNLAKMTGFQTVLEFFGILHELAVSDRRMLISNMYDTESTVRNCKSRRIAKVCNYVEANYQEPIRVNEVAEMIGMSESGFCHFFKKMTNTTFIDYVNNLRIAQACKMLGETTNTVAEICYACGFNNLSNFIRIFKKKKECTPSEYRTVLQQMLIKY